VPKYYSRGRVMVILIVFDNPLCPKEAG